MTVRAARRVNVTKMHGTQNTFVLLDERVSRHQGDTTGPQDYSALAKMLCDSAGPMAGADGLLALDDADDSGAALAAVRIINADGSEAEACGNGMRCVARYLWERGAGGKFAIQTGQNRIAVTVTGGDPFEATVDLGPVRFPREAEEERVDAVGHTWRFHDVSLGNPHAVMFVADVDAIDLGSLGRALQQHSRFPCGVNVHVAHVQSAQLVRVRHYERGAGLTQACGSGAVACAAAAILLRGCVPPIEVHVPGGALHVAWQRGEHARLSGAAITLFEREVSL